jgi:hypothetical protein
MVDLLSSGPERPRRAVRVWRRRSVRVAAVVLVAAAALALLRSTVDTSPSEVDRPVAAASPSPVPPPPAPPFDGGPGRTPIPAPTRAGGQLSGPLPASGGPDRTAAVRAVRLVLGRYCPDPESYAYTLGPDALGRTEDWRRVTVLLFKLERGGTAPSLQLRLSWTGRAYRWTGPDELLKGC